MCISVLTHKLKELKDCNSIFPLASLREEHPYYPRGGRNLSSENAHTHSPGTVLASAGCQRVGGLPTHSPLCAGIHQAPAACLLPKGQSWRARLAGSEFPSKSRPSERHLHCMPFWEHWLRSSSVSKSFGAGRSSLWPLALARVGFQGSLYPLTPSAARGVTHPPKASASLGLYPRQVLMTSYSLIPRISRFLPSLSRHRGLLVSHATSHVTLP